MSNELGTGVRTVITRMETNPEEFFEDAGRWRFIFKETFREVMTELEKGALHQALKEVRRKEFEVRVMQTLLLKDEQEQTIAQGAYIEPSRSGMGMNQYQAKSDKPQIPYPPTHKL